MPSVRDFSMTLTIALGGTVPYPSDLGSQLILQCSQKLECAFCQNFLQKFSISSHLPHLQPPAIKRTKMHNTSTFLLSMIISSDPKRRFCCFDVKYATCAFFKTWQQLNAKFLIGFLEVFVYLKKIPNNRQKWTNTKSGEPRYKYRYHQQNGILGQENLQATKWEATLEGAESFSHQALFLKQIIMEQISCNSNLPSATTSTKEHVVEEEEPAWQMVADDNSEKTLTMDDLKLLQDHSKPTIPTSVEPSTKYIIQALV